MKEFNIDRLEVRIYDDRVNMGREAADLVCKKITELLAQKEFVNIIFAAAPSQNEFLGALIKNPAVDWTRVNAFHMDEYIGLAENAPQRFGLFLNDKLFGHLPFHTVSYIDGNADPVTECGRYAELLSEFPPDIVCMGIGENGHIAFNDPHVADFNDPLLVKVIDLDLACRQQQVNDGCFSNLNDVPKHAITLTVPALMSGKSVYCMVPGKNKARAVHDTLQNAIDERCPASILRNHPDAILFLDEDSAGMLNL
ncbi:MAG: glucosamine-6-phosphate deaminase [Bacteroidetes bacterium]|nr:glucosamine-6-phosphate deaminase [Bacteroidota bacterium]